MKNFCTENQFFRQDKKVFSFPSQAGLAFCMNFHFQKIDIQSHSAFYLEARKIGKLPDENRSFFALRLEKMREILQKLKLKMISSI